MSKHTKGPWKHDLAKHESPVDDIKITGEDGHVCKIWQDDSGGWPQLEYNAVARANANLIAAAPELYEALESTTRELRVYIERENAMLKASIQCDALDEPDWHDMQTICENEKLLAKARGEKL